MKRTFGSLSATAIAALAANLCLAQTQTSGRLMFPTIPLARASGLYGTSSDPLPPPGFFDPVKAWIRDHHPLIGELAVAQILLLLLVSGTVFWVTHRRRA